MLITPKLIKRIEEEMKFTDSSSILFTYNSIISDNTSISLPSSETLKLSTSGIKIKDDNNSIINIPIRPNPTESNLLISQKRIGNKSQITPLNIPIGTISINALIVAGGGGGGNNGGGGGAGQVIKKTYNLDPLNQYKTTYTIGNGGTPEVNGGDTVLNIIDLSGSLIYSDVSQGGKSGLGSSFGNGGGGDGQTGKGNNNGKGGVYDNSVKYGRGGNASNSGEKGIIILDYISGPSEPVNFSATLLDETSISLNWDYPLIPSGTINKYTLYLPNNRIVDFTKNINNSTSYSYVIKNLVKGNSYDFSLSASNQYAEGPKTTITFKIPKTVPSPPTSLKAIAGNRNVTLSWMSPSDNGGLSVTDYKIYSNNIEIGSTTSTSFVVSDLTNNQRYNFSISSKNLSGYGSLSPSISCIPSEIQDAPTELKISPGNGKVKLEWTSSNSLNEYKIYREGVEIATTSGNSYIDSNLTNDTVYRYEIKLVGGNQISSILSMPISSIPDTPTGLKTTPGTGLVNISWNAPSDGGSPISEYKVYRDGVEIGSTSSTSYIDIGITDDKTYNYTILAVNNAGEGNKSYAEPAKPNSEPPEAPISVKAKKGNGKVSLSWKESDNNGSKIMGYKIYRDGIEIGTSTTPNFTDTDITNGTPYNYTIKAINRLGNSVDSTSVVSVPSTVPSSPIGLISLVSDKEVILSWTAPNNGGSPITGYKVYRDGFEIATTNSFTTTYKNIDLTNGRSYSYTVAAINNAGVGSQSSSVSVIPSTLPNAPINLTATSEDRTITLTWNSPLDNGGSPITGYKVYNGDNEIDTTISSVLKYTVKDLTNGTSYNFSVASVNASGISSRSSSVSAKPTTIPGVPRGLIATRGNARVSLSWLPPSDDGGIPITGYKIFRDGVEIGSSNITSYSDINLINSRNYNFTVVAINNNGSGSQTTYVSATPATKPSPPINLSAKRIYGEVSLSWKAPLENGGAPVTGYKVYRDGLEIATIISENYTDNGLKNNTSYNFSVSAVNSEGVGIDTSILVESAKVPSSIKSAYLAYNYVDNGYGNDFFVYGVSWEDPADGGSPILGYKVNGYGYDSTKIYQYPSIFTKSRTDSFDSSNNFIGLSEDESFFGKYNTKNIFESMYYLNSSSEPSEKANSTRTYTITPFNEMGDGPTLTFSLKPETHTNRKWALKNLIYNSIVYYDKQLPSKPVITATSANQSIDLSWIVSNNGGYNISQSIIIYNLYDDPFGTKTTIKTNSTNYIINALTNGKTYNFNLRSRNLIGYSEQSTFTSTLGNPPSSIKNAYLAYNYETNIYYSIFLYGFAWETPDDNGSPILGYKVNAYDSVGQYDVVRYGNFFMRETQAFGAFDSSNNFIGLKDNVNFFEKFDTKNILQYQYNIGSGPRETSTSIRTYTIKPFNKFGDGPALTFSLKPEDHTNNKWALKNLINNSIVYYQEIRPTPPSNLIATTLNDSVTLSWINNDNDNIYESLISYDGKRIRTTNKNNYTINGLTKGREYIFLVATKNVIGYSRDVSISATTPTFPDPPINLTLTPGVRQVTLSWTAPSSNGGSVITGYKVYRNGGTSPIATLDGSITTYTDTGLANNTSYSYTLAAVNAVGDSLLSSSISRTTLDVVPGQPTFNNGSTTGGVRQVTLSWTAPSSNGGSPITGYKVYRNGGASPIATLGGSITTYTDTGLVNNTLYSYTVAAVNAVGDSLLSSSISRTTLDVPGQPTGLTATSGDVQVSLSWTAPSSDGGSVITEYKVYQNGQIITGTNITGTSYTVLGLTNGTSYNFSVQALNVVGPGSISTSISITTLAPLNFSSGSLLGYSTTGVVSANVRNDFNLPTNYMASFTAGDLGGVSINGFSSLMNKTYYFRFTKAFRFYNLSSMSIRWYQGSTSSPISMEYSLLNTNYADSGTISGSFTTNSTTGKVFLGIKSSSSTGSMFSWDNFTLMITPTVPEAPILTLQSLNDNSTSVKLTWTPPYDGGYPITSYKIYQTESQYNITSTIEGLTNQDTNITMSNLNYNVTYTFTIEAINKLGSSSKSIAKTITPMNVIPPNYWG